MARPYTQSFPAHGCQILEQLNVQRYYGNFCDIVVRVQGEDFKVHKCVLAASSSKLQSLMYSVQPDASNVLTLKELTHNGLKTVVEYMYTGMLKLDAISVHEVLVASQYLELRDVEKACLEFYKSTGAEAPLPPLEAALGLVRMSGLGSGSGLPFQAIQNLQLPLQPGADGTQQNPPVLEPMMPTTLPPAPSSNGIPAHHGNRHKQGRILNVSVAPTLSPPPPPPQPVTHAVMSTSVNPQPSVPSPSVQSVLVSHTQMPGYVGPTPSMAIDTNYIEDYLKIIESIQGEQNPPHLEPQHPCMDNQVAALHVQQQDQPQLMPSTKPSSSIHNGNHQSFPPLHPEIKDARMQPTSAAPVEGTSFPPGSSNMSNMQPPPPVAVVNPRPTTSIAYNTINPAPTTSGNMNQYSAEEVRRTILSVLSQEKFDDEDEDDDADKAKDPVPLTSLLNIQPLQKPRNCHATSSTSSQTQDSLGVMPDSNMDDVPLDMHIGEMDSNSDSEHDVPETISEMSSDRDELHIHIPETPEEVTSVSCLPMPPPPVETQLQIPVSSHIDQAQNSPEPKTGGPLILRIKRNQRKGLAFDFGEFEAESAATSSVVPVSSTFQNTKLSASDWSGSGSTSNVMTEAKSQSVYATTQSVPTYYATQSMPTGPTLHVNTFSPTGHITDEGKSYVQMKPPQPVTTVTSTMVPPCPETKETDKVPCPKPFKKRLPNRSRPIARKSSLACEKCGREFDKNESLDKHMMLHNTDANNLVYSCHVCGFKYNRPGELTRHMRKHSSDSFTCHLCSAQFQEPRLYRRHMQTVHDICKPFMCSYPGCNFKADKPSHVEKHRTIHSGVKAFECPKCQKGFSQINGLRSHLKSCFERRGYECRVCGQKFNHLQTMKSHVLLHSGEKPHTCEDCGAKFADLRNFKRHRRIHENSYPYSCWRCNKKFRHSNSLKAHQNMHSKESSHAGINTSGVGAVGNVPSKVAAAGQNLDVDAVKFEHVESSQADPHCENVPYTHDMQGQGVYYDLQYGTVQGPVDSGNGQIHQEGTPTSLPQHKS